MKLNAVDKEKFWSCMITEVQTDAGADNLMEAMNEYEEDNEDAVWAYLMKIKKNQAKIIAFIDTLPEEE